MAYSPYNDVQTNYRTSDGQFFRSESDAQAHMQEQADRERGMAAIGALNDALRKERMKLWESIHNKYYKPAQNFAKQGIVAFHDQKDWEKAIEAFTQALDIYTNNNLLEQYKQELLKCARQWNQEDNEAFNTHERLEEYTAYKYAMKSVKVWQEDMEECEGMLRASKVKIGITHEHDNKADELRSQGFYFTEQKDYDKAISFFTQSLSLREDYQTYLSRAVCYEKKGDIDQAIADVTSAINCYKGRKLKMTANSLYGNRARLYKAKGEIEKAEADLKEMENWNEKPYPPPPQSTSSSYSSSSTARPASRKKKGSPVKTIIILAIIGVAIYFAFPYVKGLISKSKPATATTQTATATVNANVNFRKEPTTGDNIIRQLQQGDTVTLTGETNGSWTQIKHGSDTGWVSTEYLKK
jgi:tetratricopeptide (TPR) repeat protein